MQDTLHVGLTGVGPRALPTTKWTIVLSACDQDSAQSRHALEELCRAYWYPLYAYARRKGRSPLDAQDSIQGFFEHLFRTNALAKVRRDRGRFRSFLLASLEHCMADERDRAGALKRGRGQSIVSIDELNAEGRYLAEPLCHLDPVSLYEWRWAMDVLNEVYLALKSDYYARGKAERYDALKGFLQPGQGESEYREVGSRLSMSASAVAQEVSAMRSRFGMLLRTHIRETVATAAEVDDEIDHLIQIVSRISG